MQLELQRNCSAIITIHCNNNLISFLFTQEQNHSSKHCPLYSVTPQIPTVRDSNSSLQELGKHHFHEKRIFLGFFCLFYTFTGDIHHSCNDYAVPYNQKYASEPLELNLSFIELQIEEKDDTTSKDVKLISEQFLYRLQPGNQTHVLP